jgi:hypothetical protein
VKGILLFDELHFMDRPSFTFSNGFGSIAAESPIRRVETSLRDAGVPIFVHGAPGGRVEGVQLEQVKADVDDPQFLRRFQKGLKTSPSFLKLQIPPANYGAVGNEKDVAEKLIGVDLSQDLEAYDKASDLFFDKSVHPFNLSTAAECAKTLVTDAVLCSAKLNFALKINAREGFFPLADAAPFGDLLGAKYARAMNSLEPKKNKLQATDLSFAIFDELIAAETLKQITIPDAIRYRKASEKAREEFLEYLSAIQAKQAGIGLDGDYAGAINRLMASEIIPAARIFRNKLQSIHESLFGTLATGALGFLGTPPAAVSIFGELSWKTLLPLAGAAGAYMGKAAIEAFLAERAARRECSISYILSLD